MTSVTRGAANETLRSPPLPVQDEEAAVLHELNDMQSSSDSRDNRSGQKSLSERLFVSSDDVLDSAALASTRPPTDGDIHGTASRGWQGKRELAVFNTRSMASCSIIIMFINSIVVVILFLCVQQKQEARAAPKEVLAGSNETA